METVIEKIMKERGGSRLSGTEANQLTKECIEKALTQLMEEKNYKDISITEIVKRSGVSRSSFYRTYSSKESIMEEIRQRIFKQIGEHVFGAKKSTDIRRFFVELFTFVKENCKALEVFEKMSNWNNVIFIPQITDYYRITGEDNLYLLKMCEGGMYALMQAWIINGMKEKPEHMAELGYKMFGVQFKALLNEPII